MKTSSQLATTRFATLVLMGCASTHQQLPSHQDRLIRSNEIQVPIEGIHVGVHQRGMKLYVTATKLCDVTREDLLERTTATGSDVSREEVAEYRGVIRHAIPCADKPASDVAIVGLLGDHTVELGRTDGQGRLTLNLEQALSEEITWPRSSTLAIQADGKIYGRADLSDLYAWREAKAYADSDHDACAAPKSSGACNKLQLFVSNYPDGPNAAEAEATLKSSRPIIEQFMDNEAWGRTIAPNCEKGTAEDPAEIHASCEPFRYYLARYPSGRHAVEARHALEIGSARENRLLAQLRQKQAAAARKEGADQRNRCVAECRVGCSSWRFRDHASCFSGCIEARCSGVDR